MTRRNGTTLTHGDNRECPEVQSGQWKYCKGHSVTRPRGTRQTVVLSRHETHQAITTLSDRVRDLEMLLAAVRDRTDGLTDVAELSSILTELELLAGEQRYVVETFWSLIGANR